MELPTSVLTAFSDNQPKLDPQSINPIDSRIFVAAFLHLISRSWRAIGVLRLSEWQKARLSFTVLLEFAEQFHVAVKTWRTVREVRADQRIGPLGVLS